MAFETRIPQRKSVAPMARGGMVEAAWKHGSTWKHVIATVKHAWKHGEVTVKSREGEGQK